MPDLTTIGTLASSPGSDNLIAAAGLRGSNIAAASSAASCGADADAVASPLVEFFLLFACLPSGFILLKSFELLLDSVGMLAYIDEMELNRRRHT